MDDDAYDCAMMHGRATDSHARVWFDSAAEIKYMCDRGCSLCLSLRKASYLELKIALGLFESSLDDDFLSLSRVLSCSR
jgi:hypothetical protein